MSLLLTDIPLMIVRIQSITPPQLGLARFTKTAGVEVLILLVLVPPSVASCHMPTLHLLRLLTLLSRSSLRNASLSQAHHPQPYTVTFVRISCNWHLFYTL